MRTLTIRKKITLWFAAALVLLAGLTMVVVMLISNAVIQKGIRDDLVERVEENMDEVEFFSDIRDSDWMDGDDLYMKYQEGYLEIDDDFLNRVNGIYTSLYNSDGTLLYGENPIARESGEYPFVDSQVQRIRADGSRYYIYDRALSGEGLEELWMRGTVSETQGDSQIHTIVRLTLWLVPLLVVLAIIGGYVIAGRFLLPIKQIGEAAESIREGNDLTKRIALGKGEDELHQLANTFDRMFDRLENSFKAEQQFTSDASHELRTPITVILSECEYTLEEPREAEEYVEALEVIERQGRRMSVLIGEMLEFTRLEQNAGRFVKEMVDLSGLCGAVCDDMELVLERGITLKREITPEITVNGNPILLNRLLVNLISNAGRYGRENGHIVVKLEKKEKTVRLSVSDDGIGIEKEQQEKIWNRFYQVDPSHSGTGAGLGLAMVKSIAEFHGGSVSVESSPGCGSTFIFLMNQENGK
ncbi:MAG: HAMP domain-containing sensor histidine kinase [Eubacteriales bacterium]|nr:HAMP domain-containing sensor histidine kinase [Eubacteriales bacterium]